MNGKGHTKDSWLGKLSIYMKSLEQQKDNAFEVHWVVLIQFVK